MICSFLLALTLLSLPANAGRVMTGAARVIDGDTLEVGHERLRLHGIDAPEIGQSCRDAAGRSWDCGGAAREALARLVRGGVRCEARDTDRYGRIVARCMAGERDLGAALVAAGMAFAYRKYSKDYIGLEAEARAARRGIWAGSAERPEAVRAAKNPPQQAPGTCAIKGNISSKGRIYHRPGDASYDATRIDTSKGERWFCSEAEAEARAAGWRAARG